MEPKDRQAQHRAYILDHVVAGSLKLDEAARMLGLPTRGVRRLIVRHTDGPVGLAPCAGAERQWISAALRTANPRTAVELLR
jgi:hypothetical protein